MQPTVPKFNRMHCQPVIMGVALTFLFAFPAHALTLDEYLAQVRGSNEGLKASKASVEAAAGKTEDADMVYAPTVFANIVGSDDKKEYVPVAQRGDRTQYMSTQAGVSKLTQWGTSAKVYYNSAHTDIANVSKQFVPDPKWYEASTVLEVNHPLLKNSGGEDIKRSIELQKKQADLTALSEAFKRKLTMVDAEGVYWRLVLARESLKTAKDNLDRAQKIVQWNRHRVTNELADSSDLIQAEALAQVREIELNMASDDERSAAHAFNTARGTNDDAVQDQLVRITPELIDKLPKPERKGDREDLRLAIEAENVSDISMNLTGTKYDPTLDVFASAAVNGRDTEWYKSAVGSVHAGHQTLSLGLKFSKPLGGESISRVRGAYAKDKEAATLQASRKRYENDREWSDLTRRLEESKGRLKLVQLIETTQNKKLTEERNRQQRGRSTMFQVMQAETDYAQAQLNVIKTKAEILGTFARMKTFGGEG